MCKLCDDGRPQNHEADEARQWNPRRGFLKASAAAGATGAMAMFAGSAVSSANRRASSTSVVLRLTTSGEMWTCVS